MRPVIAIALSKAKLWNEFRPIYSFGRAITRRSSSSRAMRSGRSSASQVRDVAVPLQKIADEETAEKRASGK